LGEEKKKKKLTMEGQGRVYGKKKTMNPEPCPGVGFHHIQKIPKREFLDAALVGAGSLKP
jgi:hypothetical protein